ncbi:hypothetical protein ACJ6WD_39930 [Streptomyces sp. VTCC 41912]|uniref:hypothetical protein n=1 Tax=Streptomyces sp. VTCC 41912 TaxID=3383243 RepID=UPI003896A9C0
MSDVSERTLWGIPLSELAEDRLAAARRADEAALSARRFAADPENSPEIRAQARAAARTCREHAQDYRYEAAEFSAGLVPERYWGTGDD